ncbi:putative C-type lectin domain family 20 member A [Pangasianodon hypophthalmus]|uniref:putative C-type lectin domain family 20 member A n=1 Tax=Pangasianodon hypophthalmus TaxID=310915 RepID=UPI0023072FA2|nr:putative C-type lectin domain family 20 member A [Pangasianodon hypophthalmus]
MKHLFFLLGLTGVVPITISILQTTRGLYFINQAVTWPAAQNYCRMKYTDLARVKDYSDLLKLREMAASRGLTMWPIWIGLYNDFDSWRWSFNNLLLTNTTPMSWYLGHPDNYKGAEACGVIFSPGYWGDSNCTTLNPFICYNASNSGAGRFVGVSSPQLTWSGAQTYCRTFHTDLASALSQTDNDLLVQVASLQGPSWFGLYRDTWKWLNNSKASNLLWGSGQPDNYRPQENCGMLYDGLFGDESCTSLHYFFCEFIPPVRRQIIKLQFKSDGNVFDPAVQSSILEQMKQKLKQHGMLENTTVTWRVQPDGNIFYKKNNN